MGARKAEGFPIHLLSLSAITVDHELQSRVKMSIEDMRDYAEYMLRGDIFPPVVVFFDGDKHWLADGFHRTETQVNLARTHAKFRAIRAEVRPGTRQDAIVFSAGANKKSPIYRTKDDIKKSVWMLLDMPEWRGRSLKVVAEHVGTTATSVKRYETEYYKEHPGTAPDLKISSNGKLMPSTYTQAKKPRLVRNKRNQFYAHIDGKNVYLGTNEFAAKKKLEELSGTVPQRLKSLEVGSIADSFMARGLNFTRINFPLKQAGIGGFLGHDCVVTIADLDRSRSCVMAIGAAICARKFVGPISRCVVLCCKEKGLDAVLDLGRQMGIEFLTPEEFVASLKGDRDEGEAGVPVA